MDCCCVCRCTPCCCPLPCPPPCPPCPECPECPEVGINGIFVAAGTGTAPHYFDDLRHLIPFGNTLFERGDIVRHVAGHPEIGVYKTGDYEIVYQLAAFNPVLGEFNEIEATVSLVSNIKGEIDRFHLNVPHRLEQRRLFTRLEHGEVLMLEIFNYGNEIIINSQAIVIVKLNHQVN